jgi:hypothetical protein
MGWQTVMADVSRRQEFERAFEFLDPICCQELFATVSERKRWTQEELMALARQPRVAVTT